MTLRALKRKKSEEPSMEQELAALNDCFEALAKLSNYSAEVRVVKYLDAKLKADRARKYGDD